MRIIIVAADGNMAGRLSADFGNCSGIEVMAAVRDGAEALRCVKEFLPDVLLTDLVVSRHDGLALLEILPTMGLEKTPEIFVMAMECQKEISERALEKGAAGVMKKPVDATDAVRMMRESAGAVKTADGSYGWYIHMMMNEIGVPRHLAGYRYLYEAIAMVVADRGALSGLTSVVYPHIAQKFGSGRSCVERSMRFAIEAAWNRGRVDKIEEMFGYTVRSDIGRPTNGEFIAMTAERVRMAGAKGVHADGRCPSDSPPKGDSPFGNPLYDWWLYM